ncbi:MAG: hypothetical protein AB7J35_02495 [Dehalococcoidia bacterium]
MKDVAGLMHLAFKLAHEVSEAGLDLGQAPGLRDRPFYTIQIADNGLSALAQVAAASSTFPTGDYRKRMEAATALRGARQDLLKLRDSLKRAATKGHLGEDGTALIRKIDELTVVLMALTMEVRGNCLAA